MEKANNSINASPSRRNFIKSSAAALAVASLSTVALAKAGMEHPDRALFEAIAEWQSGHEEQERLWGIQCQLEDLAGETEPPMPSELFEALCEKAEEAEGRFADQVSKRWDKLMEIAGMSVYTGEGLAAKCQALLDEPIFGDMTGELGSEEGFIASCLIADIQEAVERGAFTA